MPSRRQPGQLEDVVLDVLWAADGPVGATAVHATLAERGHELAYTTVTTTLARLFAKGLLTRRPLSRGYVYAPTSLAAEDAAQRMRDVLGAGPGRDVVLSRFVAGLSPEDGAALRELLVREAP